MNAKAEDLDLSSMTDEEIMNFDPSRLGKEEPSSTSSAEAGDQSASSSEAEGKTSDDPGGTGSEGSSDEKTEGVGTTSAEEEQEAGNEDKTVLKTEGKLFEDNQSSNAEPKVKADTEDSSGELDYKAEYLRLLAPFKAAKREIKLDNPEDARRLMQMGVDYARKMEDMKPYRRVIKTLETAGLLDIDKLNMLIDLHKKDPAAIKKFFKDSAIDPIDLDLEGANDYKPTNHVPSDNDIALDDVLNEIRATPTFQRTIDIVTKEWDRASQKVLMDNPGILRHMNLHVEKGIYDQIIDKVMMERTLGRIQGMSDLEAYKAVGDAMLERGELIEPNSSRSSTAGKPAQASGHPNGSNASLNARKRAASPTKGSASAGKTMPDFSKMTDEQISKFDINSL